MISEKIRVILMLEVLGRPPEYIKETIEKVIEEIGKQQEVKLINKNIAKPKATEKNKEIFTTFAEVEIETDLMRLMSIIYNFMPSHVEIITPEELRIKNSDLNIFFSELVRRLHQYDEVAKSILIERQILAEKYKKGELNVTDIKEISDVKKTKKRKKKI